MRMGIAAALLALVLACTRSAAKFHAGPAAEPGAMPAGPSTPSSCPPGQRHSKSLHFPPQDPVTSLSIPGVRYAGPLTQATHWYLGLSCHDHSTFPAIEKDCGPHECPLPGTACYLNEPCMLWEHGAFEWSRMAPGPAVETTPPGQASLRACTGGDSLDHPGSFVKDVWVPEGAPCRERWYSPREAAKCLGGKRVTFAGDSMVRQVYRRLMDYIRGFPQMAEQLYHYDTHYIYNGTHDRFHTRQRLAGRPRWKERQTHALSPTAFDIEFLWRPNGLMHFSEVAHTQPDFFVHGINYWLQDPTPPEGMSAQWLKGLETATDLRALLWLTVPKLMRPDPPKNTVNETLAANYRARNDRMRDLIRTHMQEKLAPAGSRLMDARIVPVDHMTEVSPFQRRAGDKMHFMCGLSGELCATCPIMKELHLPPDGDCRDMLNLNVAQQLLNYICTNTIDRAAAQGGRHSRQSA